MRTPSIFQHPLIREISLVLLIKLVLLYGLVNFVVPAKTSVDAQRMSQLLLVTPTGKNPVSPSSDLRLKESQPQSTGEPASHLTRL